MFDKSVNYPTAVASYDDEGIAQAILWCTERMEEGDTLSVWTPLKRSLGNCEALEELVSQYSGVEHIVGRGGTGVRSTGPVLMAWPDMDDIGELVRFGESRIRGLCVLAWDENKIRPWVAQMTPEILGDGTDWDSLTPELDPIVVEALKSLTKTVNHNNTISVGWEKDQVVSVLLALRDAGIPMDGEAIQGWALAHGWSGRNPSLLAKFVEEIQAGKRPRCNKVLRPDYISILRQQVADAASETES